MSFDRRQQCHPLDVRLEALTLCRPAWPTLRASQATAGYNISLWARSFPAGMTLAVSAGSRRNVAITPTSDLGLNSVSRYGHAPGFAVQTHVLNGSWQLVELAVTARVWPAQTSFNLVVGAVSGLRDVVAPGGSVWIDDVAIRVHNASR